MKQGFSMNEGFMIVRDLDFNVLFQKSINIVSVSLYVGNNYYLSIRASFFSLIDMIK